MHQTRDRLDTETPQHRQALVGERPVELTRRA
jgi:hypothetical protein